MAEETFKELMEKKLAEIKAKRKAFIQKYLETMKLELDNEDYLYYNAEAKYPEHGELPISPPPIPPGVVRYDYSISPPEMVYADGRRESIFSNSKNDLPNEKEEPKIIIGVPEKEDD